MSPPHCFVIIDCTVSGNNGDLLGTDESEIIQIDIDIVDSELNEVIERKTLYISKADENSCKGDTNVKESDVADNSRIDCKCLKDAIKEINSIIKHKCEDHSKEAIFATSGILQLRQCLHPQAVRHRIEMSKTYFQFYNIIEEYKQWSDRKAIKSLKDIAEDITLDKDDSIPICDHRLSTEMVRKLIGSGHLFKNPEVITDNLLPGACTGYVKDETVVRVRGLPWQVSDHDVASFFRGLNISRGGVALCLNMKGRRNGEAFVKFESAEHRALALQRHKHHLSGRYIEVYKGTAQDFLKTARGPTGAMNVASNFLNRGAEVIIRMRGLPYSANATDIVNFFGNDLSIKNGENGVMLVYHPDGTSTGDAFVIFPCEDIGKAALKKHRCKIGQRYVELFRSTQAELQQVLAMYNVGYQFVSPVGVISPLMPPLSPVPGTFPIGPADRGSQRAQALMTMSCLRLRGLPFSASKDDIVTFLGHHSQGIIGTVHIIYNLQGRPSGESFVQLKSPEFAHKAANDLHLKHMGERYIEVFQCSVHDMSLMLATSHANQMQHMNQLNNNNSNTNNSCPSNHNSSNFIPGTPLALHPGHPLFSPTNSNGMVHSLLPPVAPMFNGQYPTISPNLSPNGYYPHHPFSFINPVISPENISYHMNQYGKPDGIPLGIAYQPVEDMHRGYSEKGRETNGNRPVKVFMG